MKKSIFLCVIVGFFAGIVSGFFSSGGGLIILPFYLLMLKLDDVKARATTIFCILFITSVSAFFYLKETHIDWVLSLKCGIGGIFGSFFGSKVLNKINSRVLNILLACFLVYAGERMII